MQNRPLQMIFVSEISLDFLDESLALAAGLAPPGFVFFSKKAKVRRQSARVQDHFVCRSGKNAVPLAAAHERVKAGSCPSRALQKQKQHEGRPRDSGPHGAGKPVQSPQSGRRAVEKVERTKLA